MKATMLELDLVHLFSPHCQKLTVTPHDNYEFFLFINSAFLITP